MSCMKVMVWHIDHLQKDEMTRLFELSDCIEKYNPLVILLQDSGNEDNHIYIDILLKNHYAVYNVLPGSTQHFRLMSAVKYGKITVASNQNRLYESVCQNDCELLYTLCQYHGIHFGLYHFYGETDMIQAENKVIDLYKNIKCQDDYQLIVIGNDSCDQKIKCIKVNENHKAKNISLDKFHLLPIIDEKDILIYEIDL